MLWNKIKNLLRPGSKKKASKPAEKPVAVALKEPESDKEELTDEDIERQRYWWKYPRTERKRSSSLEGVDSQEIYDSISTSLEKGKLGIIEIPTTIMSILSLLDNEEFDYNEVAQGISKSPGLTGDILAAANSAAFSRGINIKEVHRALPRLGRSTVRGILYMNATRAAMPEHPLFQKVAEEITSHSMAVAQIASYLSLRYYPDHNQAFLAGLMHDVGKLVILKEIDEKFDLPTNLNVEEGELLFRKIFPDLHERAGAAVGRYWRLDNDIITAIKHHHDLDAIQVYEATSFHLHLAALIQMSDKCARVLGCGQPHPAFDIFNDAANHVLEISDDEDAIDFLKDIPPLVEMASQSFK